MTRSTRLEFVLFACPLLLVACDEPEPKGGPAPPSSAAVSVLEAHESPPSTAPLPSPTRDAVPCRVLKTTGEPIADGKPLPPRQPLGGKTWIELPEGSSISIRHAESAREYRIDGPGRALPCLDGEETVVLTAGTFRSAAGTGARPGATVSVASRFGSISYGDASLQVNVDAKGLHAKLDAGAATAWENAKVAQQLIAPSPGTAEVGKALTAEHQSAALTRMTPALELVEACEAGVARARELSRRVLEPGPDLGQRASAHYRATRLSRLGCLHARAALLSAENTGAGAASTSELENRLQAAQGLLRAPPSRAEPSNADSQRAPGN